MNLLFRDRMEDQFAEITSEETKILKMRSWCY